MGYTVFIDLLNSSHYGVPQNRERIFLVCFRKDLKIDEFDFPYPGYEDVCLEDVLEDDSATGDYVINRPDTTFKSSDNSKSDDLFTNKSLKPVRVGQISTGGQGERIYSEYGHAIAMTAYGGGIGSKTGLYFVNNKIRKLAPRECARIFGFPEKFKIHDNSNVAYKQFGNSVVVNVVSLIIKEIIKTNCFKK